MVLNLTYGSGLGEGIGSLGSSIGEGIRKRKEQTAFQQILNPQQAQPQQPPGFEQQFNDIVNQYQTETGEQLNPEQLNMVWNAQMQKSQVEQQENQPQKTYSMQQLAAIGQKNPQLASMLQQNQLAREKMSIQERGLDQKQKIAYTKLNEPLLEKLNEKIENTEQSGSDFDRLNEIFTDEKSNLPSAWSAALFDLEGDSMASNLARSQLSPAAQEVTKIIVNQLRAAKDSFGSRVTDFDAKKFLLGFPGLMNTPEGRKAVLRNLRIINKINQVHQKGIVSAFKNAGGSGAIPYSEASSISREKNKDEVEQLRDMYINPKKRDFKRMPDPSISKDSELIDETTGQKFFSDGKQWLPIKGQKQ